MENLEKLKDVWKNQGESSIKFSENEIYNMVHKKSSSIVKWILIISILEFVLPNLFYLVSDHKTALKLYENYGIENLTNIYTIIHLVIIVGFIYVFFKNYKNISAESSVKTLLKDILKTRRTVKYYIYYNISMAAIIGIHIFYIVFNSELFIIKLPEGTKMLTVWILAMLLLILTLFIFWGFYKIIYGILLKKLNINYSELLKNE